MIEDEISHYRKIRDDYAWHPDIMDNDEENVRRLKRIIAKRLAPEDRMLMLLYADCGSYRKLGERLGVSHTCVRKEIMRIRGIILKEYGNICSDDSCVGGGGVRR